MDCIADDQLWKPEDLEGARGLFAWGPPPPSFPHPEDLRGHDDRSAFGALTRQARSCAGTMRTGHCA